MVPSVKSLHPVRPHPVRAAIALLKSPGFWILLVALTTVTQILSTSRLADGLRGAGVDAAVMFGRAPESLSSIVVVEVDDETYRKRFKNTVPFDRNVLTQLLTDLQDAGAVVIGFDLELTAPVAAKGAGNVPIVWATGLRRDSNGATYMKAFSGSLFGVARVQRGRDGIVRRYAPTTVVDGQVYPTFVSRILTEVCARQAHWEGCNEQSEDHR